MAQRFPRPLGFSRAREPSHSGNGELWPAGLALPLGSSPFPPGTPACLPGFAPGPCSGEAFPGVGGMDEPYEPSGARVWPLQAPGEAEDSPWGPPSGPPCRAHLPARLHLLFVAGPSPQVNTCITFLRRSNVRPQTVPMTAQVASSLVADEETTGHLKELYKLINLLGKLERALILLWLEERSYQEMADILGISKANVAVKLNRIKEKLKRMSNS